jgi:radical SAM superfamily enzyme YgiQ (UPF0313 family)
MLFMRYGEEIDRELHVPLGPLYLTRALEEACYAVDFRDYQTVASDNPFEMSVFLDFLEDPAPVIGLSCMANLLPFTIMAMRRLREKYPDRRLILGGVGSKAVEDHLLRCFPWIDLICRGEGEVTGPDLMHALQSNGDLADVRGISFRREAEIIHTPNRPRIEELDSIPFPAFEKIDLARYAGYGMMTSRGCPYPCTFCSVAPVWNHESFSRSPNNIVDEMEYLHHRAGVNLFLFQDEFFVSGEAQVMEFCRELNRRKLRVQWKAFGRVNLVDEKMMRAMADCGCVELRFGIESGSDRVLGRIKKGFTAAEALEVVPKAIGIFPRVDVFYVWGFPFETMEDFQQTMFQMISFRMMGARILPSLLSLLPQTEIFREWSPLAPLEFCPYLFPEFVFTGHEVYCGGRVELPERYEEYFRLISENPEIFPGFFHINLKNNVLPKLELLRQFGFYPSPQPMATPEAESCGAHSPRIANADLSTRAGG